jgi:hypothetical protein
MFEQLPRLGTRAGGGTSLHKSVGAGADQYRPDEASCVYGRRFVVR